MKLSEAIRLGLHAVKENHGLYLDVDRNGDACGCALGTAMYSVGARCVDTISEVFTQWPWLKGELPQCPACDYVHSIYDMNSAGYVISMLHFEHGWSRERIADWVATIEPQDAPTSIEQPQAAEAMK